MLNMGRLSKDKSKLTLVELPPTLFGVLNGEPGYDVYTKFRLPPRALPTLASILKEDKWKDVQMIHPQYHGKNNRLTTENWKRIMQSDILLLSSITRTTPQTITLADRYKETSPNGIVIAGGMDASYRAEDWLRHVDIVVKGEAEETLPELINQLTSEPKNLENINGIAFNSGRDVVETSKRSLMSESKFQSMPPPYYDQETASGASIGTIEEQRGCPLGCDFCAVTSTYGKIVRFRSDKQVVEAIRQLHELKMDGCVFFNGDNLAINPRKAISMLEALVDSKIPYGSITVQVSASAASNDKLLEAMRKARIRNVCVGFESINQDALDNMNKPFSAKQNDEAARKFRDYGFWIHAMMITGTDADNPETLKENLEWAKKHADSLQFFIKTPLPGTPFWNQIENEGRFLTKDFSLYDAQHCVVQPAHFTPYELQKAVFDAYRDFYSLKSSLRRFARTNRKVSTAEIMLYTAFGGLNNVINNPQSKQYLEFLKARSNHKT